MKGCYAGSKKILLVKECVHLNGTSIFVLLEKQQISLEDSESVILHECLRRFIKIRSGNVYPPQYKSLDE